VSRRYWIGAFLSVFGAAALIYGMRLRQASFSLEHDADELDAEPAAVDVDDE
jgi:hypothetical protein